METVQLPIHIFMADDDEDDRFLFAEALSRSVPHARVKCYNGCRDLLLELRDPYAQIPDVIFLDINMPEKDGFTCLKEIRGMTAFANLPVIIFTTSEREEDINRTYEYGGNLYMRKPATFVQLKEEMIKMFGQDWKQRLQESRG